MGHKSKHKIWLCSNICYKNIYAADNFIQYIQYYNTLCIFTATYHMKSGVYFLFGACHCSNIFGFHSIFLFWIF